MGHRYGELAPNIYSDGEKGYLVLYLDYKNKYDGGESFYRMIN